MTNRQRLQGDTASPREISKNTGLSIKEGWHAAVAYVLGFWVLYLALGWHPDLLLRVGG